MPTTLKSSYSSGRSKVNLENILFFCMMFSLIFDYRRSDVDSSSLVVILSLINVFCSSSLILLIKKFEKNVIYTLLPIWTFIFISISSGIMRDQSIYSVLAQILPAIIFLQAAFVCSSYVPYNSNSDNFLNIIALSAIFSGIWKFLFSFSYLDLNLEDVRYQIISGATILLFSYAITSFVIKKRKYMWLSLFLSLGVVFISVTRTYILVFLFSIFVTTLALPSSRLKNHFFKGIFLLIVLIFSIFLLQIFVPSVDDRWLERIFSYQSTGGEDLTTLTRIAEINGQIKYMKEDILGFIFGFGIAAPTEWSGIELTHIYALLGAGAESRGYSYGHNFYVGCIYVGGIIFGTLLIAILLYAPLKGQIKLKRVYYYLNDSERFLAMFSICAILGYSAFGLLGGTFGDRVMSFYYGIAFGLLVRFNTAFINKNIKG